MAYQSLYLRYRPARFGEIIGQEHVVAALRNAVGTGRVGHAYLFSGPRGTGKTSTARILAKALNCENLTDGEPCGTCAACTSIAAGTSYELHELDAASNNKVDDVRELISRVALGTPGRAKVYVLDEVHMLTPGAENALLKTLEEPPPHVVFVLCTTEPHKVAPTIRSRTQHLHFELLDADALESHVRAVAADAGLAVSDADVAYVLAAGGGSARDTLSALDATAAAGRAPDGADAVTAVLEAVATADTAAALSAADAAARAGREPRILGEAVLGRLRNAFLASMEAPLDHLPAAERHAAEDLAGRLRPRALTYALELLGEALVAMREAPDPRVDLDLALVRLTNPDIGVTLQSLAERVERLESGSAAAPTTATGGGAGSATAGAGGTAPATAGGRARPSAAPPPHRSPAGDASPEREPPRGGVAAGAREALARARPPEPGAGGESPTPEPAAGPVPAARPAAARAVEPPIPPREVDSMGMHAGGAQEPVGDPASRQAPPAGADEPATAEPPPERDEAVLAWVEEILPSLRNLSSLPKSAGARLAAGRFLPNTPSSLRLAFSTPGYLDGCATYRSAVEAEFGRCFDRPVTVEFVLERDDHSPPDPPIIAAGGAATRSPYLGEVLETTALPKARPTYQDDSGVAQVQQAFPGSRLVELEAP
ncbi:MAG: DNA polymerase III subunit gamma/tau [Acidimicrobiia bacterium]|nr:DNA polymerase III subunit gamma/tau [Acidimicrobiia bacterium]MYC46423.1 DNA polymerase III subunit gamma/tau [Acidimicrobiia bacterium]MYI21044.1 DNA polymerase III subunit gamma/tau [Acidimicrobiia bacterium]